MYKRTNLTPQLRHIVLILIGFFISPSVFSQQKVGLVLSGGGATGLAHIGVLKALEEKNIPIDYITGTSAGALIGAMYASGYSPLEIEKYFLSENFLLMANGKIRADQRFYLREDEKDADLINFTFTLKNLLKKSLPTNFITSSYLDYEMMRILGTVSASRANNFDSLFIPFRCVAADITNKKSITFNKGNLNEVVRASMTFPFYMSPLKIDNNLLFDGGLYNNFPADVMYQDFNPDFIIGSNVSYNASPPSEDDLISQVINMLVSHTNFEIPCEYGIIIKPKTEVTTFDFESVQQAINDGYNSTLTYLDSIQNHIEIYRSQSELDQKRENFKKQISEFRIKGVISSNTENKKNSFVERSIFNNKKSIPIDQIKLENRYFRLYSSSLIDFMFPTLERNSDNTYKLKVDVRKSKPFKIEGGGHYSSRPVNTGYFSISYRKMGFVGSNLKLNSYFGKFYGSIKSELNLDIPSVYPITISPYFVMNRWDYFRSFSTFFEEVKPSFLVQNEMYYGAKLSHSILNTTKSTFDFRFFDLEDDYYQTNSFTNKDTTDKTFFNGLNFNWHIEKNTLNRKQFANEGHFFSLKIKYINGQERSISGSTSGNKYDNKKFHHWLSFNSEIQHFIIKTSAFHFGIHGKGVLNTQSLFQNYTASLLAMSSFSPIADIETFFLPEYRSPQHIGIGTNLIFTLKNKLDLRFDGYFYQPFVTLIKKDDNSFGYSSLFKGETYIASTSLIYHTFFGPIRATANYFPKQKTPIYFQLSYGYVLFNERAIR